VVRSRQGADAMTLDDNLVQSVAGGDGELVLKFFATFSAFECALKQAHFVKGDRYNNAVPNWDAFSGAVSKQLAGIKDDTFTKAKQYLLQKPPMKQVLIKSSTSVGWAKNSRRGKEPDEQYLLRLVRDVRNNLFHGGKYPSSRIAPPSAEMLRNKELLEACLTILGRCQSLNAGVRNFFMDALVR
jgi:hypothetical protein